MRKPPRKVHAQEGGWLVVSAWPAELARLEAALPTLPSRVQRQIRLASVGVGLVEAAMNTARLLAQHRPACVLLVGTAGVYPGRRPDLPLGGAALIDKIVLLPEILPGKHAYLPDLVPRRERSTSNLRKVIWQATRLPSADVACPLAITASARAAATGAKLSGCALENLEAFAVARAATTAGVPFAAILGIANHVGPGGHREWQKHAKIAAAAACAAALALLSTGSLRSPLHGTSRG